MGKLVKAVRDITWQDFTGEVDNTVLIEQGSILYNIIADTYMVLDQHCTGIHSGGIWHLPPNLFSDVQSWTLRHIIRARYLLQEQNIKIVVSALQQKLIVILPTGDTLWFDTDDQFVDFLQQTVPEAFDD